MSAETTAETGKKFVVSVPRIVANVVHMVLLAAAMRDLRQRPAEEINGNKRMWYGIVFIQLIGPIAYFAVGRKREAAALPALESVADVADTARLAQAEA